MASLLLFQKELANVISNWRLGIVLVLLLGNTRNCRCQYWNDPPSSYGNLDENMVSNRIICRVTQKNIW